MATLKGISDVLGFADGVDAGHKITFYRHSEFFFEGIRFNPGTYEIRKVPDKPSDDSEPAF
jgi:hypothetical protein